MKMVTADEVSVDRPTYGNEYHLLSVLADICRHTVLTIVSCSTIAILFAQRENMFFFPVLNYYTPAPLESHVALYSSVGCLCFS
jgi:hypothetical protein